MIVANLFPSYYLRQEYCVIPGEAFICWFVSKITQKVASEFR